MLKNYNLSYVAQNHSSVISLKYFVYRWQMNITTELCGLPLRVRFDILFTAVGVGIRITPITVTYKGPPAQIFLRRHVFCSPGHCLLISAMTLTFGHKVKLGEHF